MTEAMEPHSGTGVKAWQVLAALAVVYFFVTGWNLSLQHIVNPDEPRYAFGARGMLDGGDPFVPIFNTDKHLEKPVLFHWLLVGAGALSRAVGIPIQTGFRLVPLCMGFLAVAGLYLLGRRLLNERGALVAALILMTSYHFHNVARELVVDMTLTAWLLWSWLFVHIALGRLERGERARGPLLGFYLCLGCACLTKGPFLVAIFSVVPLLAVAAVGAAPQLPYATASDQELGLPPDRASLPDPRLAYDIPDRCIPAVTIFSNLSSADLAERAVPLPRANTLAHLNYQARRFGRLATEQGAVRFFNPETVLVRFRGQPMVCALRVEPLREWDAVQALRRRADVEFAELDTFERRQFVPNDPQLATAGDCRWLRACGDRCSSACGP